MKIITSSSIAGAAALAAAILSSHSARAAAYTSGHGDIGVEYEAGELELHLHLGEGGNFAIVDGVPVNDTEFAPDELVITVPAFRESLAGNSGTFLGVPAGHSIWTLPTTNVAGAPYLGWATEELNPADWTGNISFTFGSVVSPSGAGHFAVWQLDEFGDLSVLAMSTFDPGADILTMIPGNHDHYLIGFTEPGTWTIDLTASGTHVDDGLATGSGTFTFHVVPEPGSALLAILGAISFGLRRRR